MSNERNVSACYDAALAADERGVVAAAREHVQGYLPGTWIQLVDAVDDASYSLRPFSHPTVVDVATRIAGDVAEGRR